MNYDFDTVIPRRGTDSLKWDVPERDLPMWVADMDFAVAPEIAEALSRRIKEGVFGYSIITEEWYDAYIGWWRDRHDFLIEKEWLVFCTGVIPAISSAVRKLTTPNEKVLIQTPVYNTFYNCIRNNGRRVLECPLHYENQTYTMDFGALETALSDPETTLMLLCNPQNPAGVIWDRETLEKVGDLCRKYGVTVLSDEIHCDLTEPGKSYVPFASVSETCRDISITLITPTKAFNLAGLKTAAVFASDSVLRHKMWRALNTDEVAEPNSFALPAAVAAFTEGAPWLDALRSYVWENKRWVRDFLSEQTPELTVACSDATYLMWVDGRALPNNGKGLSSFLRNETGLYVMRGEAYGPGGEGFFRMNVACPRSLLMDGMDRLSRGVSKYKAFYG